MAGALGAGLGLLLNAVGGYAGEKLQQKHTKEANEASIIHDIAVKHPEAFASSPDMQKSYKKHFGDESLQMVMGVGQLQNKAKQQAAQSGLMPGPSPAGQMISGGQGGVAPASAQGGAPPQGQQQGYVEPSTPDQMRQWMSHYEQFQASGGLDNLPDDYKKGLEKRYERYMQQAPQIEEKELSRGQQASEFQQRQADLKQHQQEMAQMHQDNMAMTHAFAVSLAGMHEQNEKDNAFTAHLGTLQNSGRETADKVSKLPPDEQESAANRYNREVDNAFKVAKKSGINVSNFGSPDDYKLHLDRKTKSWATGLLGTAAGALGPLGPETETGSLEPGAPTSPEAPSLAVGERLVRDKSGKPIGKTKDGKTMEPL